MRIIGVDPGTRITGYGVIDASNSRVVSVAYGCVKNSPKLTLPQCFSKIFRELTQVIATFKPNVFAIEDIFYCKNVRSAVKLGEARGVALLTAAEAGLETFEYTPRKVKMSVVGNGGAEKAQVQKMVQMILGIHQGFDSEDVSDALAIAICHAHTIPLKQRV
ncbi:MAG: crossover junction endodeoxyribonuclease RuvC [Candidatus Ancaeobacter aquaticus]|nr:crossover junction endodeoxyribonuclease RuvC [Candidatus Ancaeobacter aquaticus]